MLYYKFYALTLRCPATAPTTLKTKSMPTNYRHLCTDGANRVRRLNKDYHHAVYLIDNDDKTFWLSEIGKSATVTLTLKTTVQVYDTITFIHIW